MTSDEKFLRDVRHRMKRNRSGSTLRHVSSPTNGGVGGGNVSVNKLESDNMPEFAYLPRRSSSAASGPGPAAGDSD